MPYQSDVSLSDNSQDEPASALPPSQEGSAQPVRTQTEPDHSETFVTRTQPRVSELDPAQAWGFLLHDYQLDDYWGAERVGKTRWAPKQHGDPETVVTFRKEERVKLSPAWQDFHKLLFTLAAFGEARLALFPQLQKAFDSVMAPNRVITNNVGFPDGYMPLCLGGNVVRLLSEQVFRLKKFGLSYKIETLDANNPPPAVEEVFWEKPWLWSKATVARYAMPEDNIQGIDSSWHHVMPFQQLDAWGAHVPLLNISYGGWNYVQTARVRRFNGGPLPNPYNPRRDRAYP